LVKEKYKAAKEATKASLGEASRSFFGVRKEEEGMMEELFPGEPTRAQGYQDGGRPFTKDFEYGRKKPLTKKQIEGIISRYAEKQLGLVEELPEVEKIEKPKAVLSKYGVSTIKPFSKPWEMLKKKLGNEIDDQVNLWKTRQLLESGVVKSEEEKENLRKYISQGDRLIGGVARGEFRSIDVDVDKEYGKFRMMGKMYGNLRDVAFRKEIERRFGADWHKKFYPNLPPDPESLAIQYEALKNAYPHLTVPMSLAKTIDELPGTDQLPSYDGGGRVAQTGPAFVHEGEWIVPKKFADGGAVGPATFDKNVLKGSSLDIDWDEIKTTIETAIKDAIESAEFPKLEVTDDLPMLDVDVADKKVGVETAGVEVSLNAAEAIAGIEAALKNVNVGAGGAVGAERLDKVDLAVDTLTNRIFDLEDTVDRKIKQEMEMLNGSVVSREVINEIIQTKIDPLRTEINSSYSIGDGYRRDIENLKEHIGTRIEMLEAQLNRVTTHVGGA